MIIALSAYDAASWIGTSDQTIDVWGYEKQCSMEWEFKAFMTGLLFNTDIYYPKGESFTETINGSKFNSADAS